MARRRSQKYLKSRAFHAKVIELLHTRHADWSEWEEAFLLDNAQRPDGFKYSEAQWKVLDRLNVYARSFGHYGDYTVQALLAVAYPARFDLNEDAQGFLETLKRWEATDLKRRQIKWLAAIARQFVMVGYDDFECADKEQEQEAEFAA